MSVSASSQVDDFLSKFSALSQQRLRDNQKTQRELNSLRESPYAAEGVHGTNRNDLAISDLRFNRSKRSQFHEEWKHKEIPPPMPARPDTAPSKPDKPASLAAPSAPAPDVAPKLPIRPDEKEVPPTLPKRPNDEEVSPALPQRPQYSVNLSVPVARASPEKPEPIVRTSKWNRGNLPGSSTPAQGTTGAGSDAPQTASKVNGARVMHSFLDIENDIRKGSRPSILSDRKEAADKSEKPEPVKPPKPPKFQSKESEMLHQKIRSLSPTKRKPAVPPKTQESVPVELKASVQALKPASSGLKAVPKKPSKPQALAVEHEALLALEKLKKPVAMQQKRTSIPEAMLKLQSIKKKSSRPGSPGEGPGVSINKDSNAEKSTNNRGDSTNNKLEDSIKKPQDPIKKTQDPIKKPQDPIKKPQDPIKKPQDPIKVPQESRDNSVQDLKAEKRHNDESSDLKSHAPMARNTNFQAQLANVLRASTDPSIGTSAPREMRRSKTTTDTSSTNATLSHPNKSRAKGPRRKLPKKVGGSSESESQQTGVTPELAKPKKVPPPKAKKPNFDLHNRFNSDVFI